MFVPLGSMQVMVIMCSAVKRIVKTISIPFSGSMPEFTVVGSCNGLLCLCDSLYKDAVYIYNPFTNYYAI